MLIPDENYIQQRNALIPEAEKFADDKFGKSYKGKSDKERNLWRANWNLAYHSCMDMLWREHNEVQKETNSD